MEDFNIDKYFREKLFEQDDVIKPEDDEVDSAFTKQPDPEPEEDEEDDGVSLKMDQLKKYVSMAQDELAKNIKQGMSTLNPEVINKKWLLDSIKIGADDRGLADELMDEISQRSAKQIEKGNTQIILYPLVKRILDTYFFKYFYPNIKELKPNQIADILDNMGSILEDGDDFSTGEVRYYENNFKYIKDGLYDKYEFDDNAATIIPK